MNSVNPFELWILTGSHAAVSLWMKWFCPVRYTPVKETVAPGFLRLWLLKSCCPLFHNVPYALGGEAVI